MKIQPVTGPGAIQDKSTPEHVRTARAVAAFNKGQSSFDTQPEPQVVQNQTQISPEELGAIRTPSRQNIKDESLEATETAQEPLQDAPPEIPEPTAPPVQDPALSRQFAQLARQEKILRAKVQAQEQAFRTKELELKEKEAQLQAKYKDPDYSSYIPKDRIKQETLNVLAEAGVSYDDLTQQIINRQPVDPQIQATINELKNEIKSLKQANEDGQKYRTEEVQTQRQAAIKQIKQDAFHLVKNDPIAYEAISKTGSVNDIVDLITKTYDKEGIVLSVEEAAQEVENHIIEESVKLHNIQKIQQRLQANRAKPVTNQVQKPQNTQSKQPQPMKTLTNAASSSRQLNARERAILAFKGEKF